MDNSKNILVLMCDHHRFDALGCLGNPLAPTPNLDRLASESIRFDNCYTQSPVCAPARHSLATGRYPHAHGMLNNDSMPYKDMVTIAHALEPLGYRRFGGGSMHWRDPEIETGYEPSISKNDWQVTLPKHLLKRFKWEADTISKRTTAGPSPRKREHYSGYHVAMNAISQIESAVENDSNFLCWVAFSEPHPPFYPPKEIYESFDQSKIELPPQAPPGAPPSDYILNLRKEWAHLTEVEVRQILAGYYGMIALVDEYLGMVIAAVDRLGIREQTVIIWTSDHGDQMWEHELFLKFCMYEGSVHVPLLIHLPEKSAKLRSELVEHIDLFPTICELVGAKCPDSVQGRSLLPLLGDSPPPDDWRRAVYSQIDDVQMVRTYEWKLNVYDGKPGELYNLQDDPNEFDNKISNPEYRETVDTLLGQLMNWEKDNK